METLNILAITLPFILAAGAAGLFKSKVPIVRASVFITVFLCLFTSEYVSYQVVGFPPWMRWLVGIREALDTPETKLAEPAQSTAQGYGAAESMSDVESIYRVDDAEWMKKNLPNGRVYECLPCKN